MSSELLKWIAHGIVACVMASTVWLAATVHTEQPAGAVLLAQASLPAEAASAAAR
jgi:hypothetical protein